MKKNKNKVIKKALKVKKSSTPTVTVIGLWHLGLVHTASLAKLGFNIVALDPDSNLIQDLQKDHVRLYEPQMTELLKSNHKSGRIKYTTESREASSSDLVVLAYDTPLTPEDDVDLRSLIKSLKEIAPYLKSGTPVVVASQIPVGTCEDFQKMIREVNPAWKSGIVCMPENLRLGMAIDRFLKPDFLVFGCDDEKVGQRAARFFEKIKTEKRFTTLRNAEMVKHAINFHLAVSITYANQLAQLAEALGADAVDVSRLIRLDPRIGLKAPLFPGLGFSGGTLARDVRLLSQKAKEFGIKAPLVQSVSEINDQTFESILDKLADHLGDLKSKNITILGITYKPNTSTLRRSPAVRLAEMLKNRQVNCSAYDPMADDEETKSHSHLFTRKESIELALKNADGVVVVTEWPEFQKMNLLKAFSQMKNPLLIDTKNFLDPAKIKKAGFKYEGFGRLRG